MANGAMDLYQMLRNVGPGGVSRLAGHIGGSPVSRVAGHLGPGVGAGAVEGIGHQVNPLQALLEQLRAHVGGQVPNLAAFPVGSPLQHMIHGFGPGGHVTGPGAGAGSGPLNAHALRGLGHTAAAANLWEQRHPLAMGGGAGIPDWVAQYIASQRSTQSPAPSGY